MAKSLSKTVNSREAFLNYIHHNYYKQLVLFSGGLARKFQIPTDVSDELIQDFYVQMGTKWEKFIDGYDKKGFAYLAKSMKNLFLDQKRKVGYLKLREQAYGEKYLHKVNPHFSIDLFEKELLDLIQENLSSKEFEVLHYYIRGYQYNEIAEELGIPEGTVSSRMHRARKKVAELLGLKFSKRGKNQNKLPS